MINPIQLSTTISEKSFFESLSIDSPDLNFESLDNKLFQEAVFSDGKKSVYPLVEKVQAVKDRLDELIKEQDDSISAKKEGKSKNIKYFDPKAFWKDNTWKEFEDEIYKIFGFRSVNISPFIESYNSKDKIFQSKMMNCFIFSSNRFPIEGLVTDKGFYDKSRSINIDIRVTLGLVKELSAEEVVAVFLHEFGHAIDPALVDIKFTEINILSKYITDRKGAINKDEKKYKSKLSGILIGSIIYLILLLGIYVLPGIIETVKKLFMGKDKYEQSKIDKIKKLVQKDKDKFNRQNYSEAFADNFARMYGFGSHLMSGLKKLSKDMERQMRSRYTKERTRQKVILTLTEYSLRDVHKTDIHRIRNLINEYKIDINDPNTSPEVKKQLQDDLKELELVLNEYLNNFNEFQNRINKAINEELEKMESKDDKSNKKKDSKDNEDDNKEDKKEDSKNKDNNDDEKKDKPLKEGFEFFDESSKAYEKLMKAKESITSSERSKVKELFGQSNKCSFAKDKDGYYCYTHRCRSKSYPEIEKIPMKDVEFVRSTC